MIKPEQNHPLHFGAYTVTGVNGQILRRSRPLPLSPKAVAVLWVLASRAGQLVSKDELLTEVWAETVVSEGVLTNCIRELRQALGDTTAKPRYIETVHRRGYRFLPAVTTQPAVSRQQAAGSRQKGDRDWRLGAGASLQAPSPKPLASSLVGREAELTQLHNWLEKAANGERQIVFVTGEPGIGKTTLVEAFLSGVREQGPGNGSPALADPQTPIPDPWVAHGQCIEQYGHGEPYMPILEAIGRLCRGPEGEHVIAILRDRAPTWMVQMPTLLATAELEVLQRQTQGATRERMLREMGDAIDALTSERPLVLVLEDLHWSDVSTIELLALLARRREPARLLVISTYRPVDVIVQEHPLRAVERELQLHRLCDELRVNSLSEAQVAEYLGERFPGEVPLQELARGLHRRTEGNPLFLVTTVEDLIEQQVLVQQEGQWALNGKLASIETRVPGTVRQLIEQQIERLSADERAMLEVASVAGMEFSAAAIAAGMEAEMELIEERCEGLARQGHFLRASGAAAWPDGTVAGQYSFLHALHQEVLYARLPAGRRQRLHQRIGQQIEQAYGERAKELAAELAVHFEHGRDYGKAVQYLHYAGELANKRSAYVEAIALVNQGLKILHVLPPSPERDKRELGLLLTLGVALVVTKSQGSVEDEQVHSRARDLSRQINATEQLFLATWKLWAVHLVRGELDTAHELGTQMLALAHDQQNSDFLVEAHFSLGDTLCWMADARGAREHLEQAITLYVPQQHYTHVVSYGQDPGVFALCYASWVLYFLGFPDQALKKAQTALGLAQELAHPYSIAMTLGWVARVHYNRRDARAALVQADAAIALAREHGFLQMGILGKITRGWALAAQDQREQGIEQLKQSAEACEAIGVRLIRMQALHHLLEVYENSGRIEEGRAVLTEMMTLVRTTGARYYEAELYRLQGQLALQQFQVSGAKFQVPPSRQSLTLNTQAEAEREAEECFRKAIDVAREQHAKSSELRTATSLARLWRRQGKRAEAHKVLLEVYDWFTEGFDTKDLQEARALLEELAGQKNRQRGKKDNA